MVVRRRKGFTLVELLVVITIIGILIALLLPAVQSARESARRLQCSNNLKQLSMAVLQYHEKHEIFPPCLQYPDTAISPTTGAGIRTSPMFGPNWVIMVLPYFEQQSLYDAFNLDLAISHDDNRAARGTLLNAMLCPTDVGRQGTYDDGCLPGGADNGEGTGWARGNYAASASAGYLLEACNDESRKGKDETWGAESDGWKDTRYRGIMGPNVACRMAHIRDGASNTFLLGEVRVGVNSHDRRGTWAMGTAGASCLFGYGYQDARGPNACSPNSDDILGCCYLEQDDPGEQELLDDCMTCHCGSKNAQATIRSLHFRGAFVAFADGSVHFIDDFIDLSGGINSVWNRLISSADGLPIDASKVGL